MLMLSTKHDCQIKGDHVLWFIVFHSHGQPKNWLATSLFLIIHCLTSLSPGNTSNLVFSLTRMLPLTPVPESLNFRLLCKELFPHQMISSHLDGSAQNLGIFIISSIVITAGPMVIFHVTVDPKLIVQTVPLWGIPLNLVNIQNKRLSA